MAYYNVNGQITIDEVAANADVQKIRQAIQKLQESQNSLKKLISSASSMQGQTGSAIVEKSQQLSAKIESLNDQLNGSISYINKTVQKYKQIDQDLKNKIVGGSGV